MVRFGVLGTANIARAFLGVPLDGAEIVAVASRDRAKAAAFAGQYRIPLHFGSYEQLIADPHIDAVYIPLPQHLHCEYVIKAAGARKHVLVEKPAALNVNEVQKMIAACRENGVLLMEAFMYRFLRVHNRAREIVQAGTIGELRSLEFAWSINIDVLGRSAFRLDKNNGGGALYDLGIYGVDFIRFITGAEPELISATVQRRDGNGVDELAHAVLQAGKVLATVTCGFNADINFYALGGERGAVYSPIALSGRTGPRTLMIHLLEGDQLLREDFTEGNPYKGEMEYFSRCIERHEEPFVGGENMLGNMIVLEEIFKRATELWLPAS